MLNVYIYINNKLLLLFINISYAVSYILSTIIYIEICITE